MSIYNVTASGQSFTLPPATPVLIAPINASRKLLMLENTGSANPATFKFQTAPASATDGFTLDPASVTGGQGGSLVLHDDADGINDGCAPIDAIYAYSALGTTVTVLEGVTHFL
jgi:hypothetical protein